MLGRDLREMLVKDPFDPFRIRLINGDFHDVFDPVAFYIYRDGNRCFHATQDGNLFKIDAIVSLESLLTESAPPVNE